MLNRLFYGCGPRLRLGDIDGFSSSVADSRGSLIRRTLWGLVEENDAELSS